MRYTKDQIKDYLLNKGDSLDSSYGDYGAGWSYYLHLDEDGKLVDRRTDYGKTFLVAARYIDALGDECNERHPDDPIAAADEFWDRVYDTEETEDFDEVVEQMTDIVNAYLAEKEEEDA